MALGTVIAAGIGLGKAVLKGRNSRRRSTPGVAEVSYASLGPRLFEDRTLEPGGGVLQRGVSRARKGGMVVSSNGKGFPDKAEIDLVTGEIREKPRRRRRKRLLTCADRQDITFITATLGKGQMAQTAIASLLARCN